MTNQEAVIYYERLFVPGAAVLIEDGTEPYGMPIFVTRKIMRCCAVRISDRKILCIQIDKELSDGCVIVSLDRIFGMYNGKDSVNISNLTEYLEKYPGVRELEKTMLISDAKIRLREAYK